MPSSAVNAIAASLQDLSVTSRASTPKQERTKIADSWEDEIEEDSSSDQQAATPVRPSTSDLPRAPPPTPATPAGRDSWRATPLIPQTHAIHDGYDMAEDGPSNPKQSTTDPERRPDKTTAVASRLIAAAIGQRPPQRTKEQREYDQAMKAQERKKREHAKAEEERKKREKEQAQKDIWGD